MKYLLSILCLFVLSCDNGNDDYDITFVLDENFTIPMDQNRAWVYDYTEGFYINQLDGEVENTLLIEGILERTVIENIGNQYELDSNCNHIIEEIYSSEIIFSSIDDGWNENPHNYHEHEIDDYDGTYYSFYSNDVDSFESCGSFEHQSEQNNEGSYNDGMIDGGVRIPGALNLLNTLKLDYPLYVGKIWQEVFTDGFGDPIISYNYEVVSVENIILDINGNVTLFECYKIVLDNGFNTTEYYLSSQGIIKIKLVSSLMDVTTAECPDCTGYTWYFQQELIIIDY